MSAEGLEALRIVRPPDLPRGRGRTYGFISVGLALAAAVAVPGYTLYLHAAGRPLAVQTVVVAQRKSGAPGVVLTGSGYIVTRHKYITVGTKVQGQIVAEPIEEGQIVKRGDLLARIDDRDYQDQLRQAIAVRDLAAANLRLMRAKADRRRDLLTDHSISKEEYDIAQNDAEVAEATLRRDDAAVDYARFQVDQCRIESPIAGVVLQKYREVGATINYSGQGQSTTGATDIAQLADTRDMRAEVDVNESDIAKLAIGMPATVVPDAYPDARFDATLVKIYPEADRQKATVKVEVHIRNPDLSLIRPELSVKANFLERSIPTDLASPSVVVPATAIVGGGPTASVWTIQSGIARRTTIQRGRDLEGGIEVRQGLGDGALVIVSPPAGLRDGQAVRSAGSQ